MTALSLLALTSERLAATSKRGDKQRILAQTLLSTDAQERGSAALFLSGNVRQPKLSVGYAQLPRLRSVQPAEHARLTLAALDTTLQAVAEEHGAGASARRMERLGALFQDATAVEQRFVIGLLLGELRQGAAPSMVLDAVAAAAEVSAEQLRRAFMLSGDLAAVVQLAFDAGETGLAGVSLRLFRPILPMLAETATDVESALAQLGEAALEYKLDGARVQVHRDGDEVRVYTRTGNDVTHAVPEVVALALSFAGTRFVLDGEVLALRPDGKPFPFQETMRRFGRKLDVAAMQQSLPLSAFFFDCLVCGDESLLDAPTTSRFESLQTLVPKSARVPRIVTADRASAIEFAAAAFAAGHEGVMAKACGAPYAAGKRGANWLKVKRVHTLDLVVLAAEWGSGRRRGWLSNLHLGARDESTGQLVMLGKTFKGLTDELLRYQTEALLAREIRRDGHIVFVRPELVVEIAVSDIQRSPRYPAGLALRLARVKRYRPDKAATQASSLDEVRRLYEQYAGPQAGLQGR